MTLIAGNPATKGRGETIAAFGTPNVVHFGAALLVGAILTIPWEALRPAVAYSTLWIAGATFTTRTPGALFWIGAAALLLVFIGIHNAWDTVTYVTMQGTDAPL